MPSKNEVEVQILLALFNATMEQMEALTGKLKQHTKLRLNSFKKQGMMFEAIINKQIELAGTADDYDEITDVVHDGINKLRIRYNELD